MPVQHGIGLGVPSHFAQRAFYQLPRASLFDDRGAEAFVHTKGALVESLC